MEPSMNKIGTPMPPGVIRAYGAYHILCLTNLTLSCQAGAGNPAPVSMTTATHSPEAEPLPE